MDWKGNVMPQQKDLKRLVRARMEKTGEAYTTAKLHLVKKKREPEPDYAALAGMADDAVKAKTGRDWKQWLALLDEAGCTEMTHRDIARYVASIGTSSWWTQTVTVGYERIRGLRQRLQQRSGEYQASKSRTFHAPLARVFAAFTNARTRKRWLPMKMTIKSSAAGKRMRLLGEDGSTVLVGFVAKGDAKTSVSIEHHKLPSAAAVAATKKEWGEHFDRLAELLD